MTKSSIDYKKVLDLYERGESDTQIAEAIGCSEQSVRNWRLKNKLPPMSEVRLVEDVKAAKKAGMSYGQYITTKAAQSNDPQVDKPKEKIAKAAPEEKPVLEPVTTAPVQKQPPLKTTTVGILTNLLFLQSADVPIFVQDETGHLYDLVGQKVITYTSVLSEEHTDKQKIILCLRNHKGGF